VSNIVRIEVGRFDYDFIGEFKFFKPDPDGKIRRPSVLVRITDENGVQGWGQAVPTPSWTYETPETVTTTIENYLAKPLLGQDPQDIENIHDIMHHEIRPACSIGQPLAKAAIDLACYDLIGKQLRQSIAEYLGGSKTEQIKLSWTVNSMDMEVIESQLEEGRSKGYTNFNFKVGPPQTERYDLELAKVIRDFSPDGFLWADANTGYSEDAALAVMPKLADVGVEVMESPLRPHQIRGYQALTKQGAIPIFMDEGIILDEVVEEFIALGMVDGITIKTARAAGILHNKRIIEVVQKHGKQLLGSGLTDPDISMIASLHLFAWAGIDKPCALNGPQYLANTLVTSGIHRDGDTIDVPKSAGLGIELDAEAERYLSVAAEL
jgi:L-alanine-DL-glutamate epimerase-like enolase superfamily enzyme